MNTLRDLEGIQSNVLKSLYDYKMIDEQHKKEESKKITREYKSGVIDPSSIVARCERRAVKSKIKYSN